MAQPTVLISGAGIAGPALAFWLNKSGYRVTIVELADGIRPSGQSVDLRGRVTLAGDAGYCACDIAATAQVMKWTQRWPFRSFAERKWFTTADAIDLPDY